MLSSIITHALIPLLTVVSFPHHQIRAENDLHHVLDSSSPPTTPETTEDIMNENSNMNCARLRAFLNSETFQAAEKVLNMTAESTLDDNNTQRYHLRIKRCNDTERRTRNRRKKPLGGKLKQKSKEDEFREATIHESTNISQEDSSLADDLSQAMLNSAGHLSQTMLNSESTEPYLRTYRTLPVNVKQLTSDSPSTSISQDVNLATTEQSSVTNLIGKSPKILKKGQRTTQGFSRESKPLTSASGSLAIDLYTASIRNRNNPKLEVTNTTKKGGERKKGSITILLENLKYTMEGGRLKNIPDFNDSDKLSADKFQGDKSLEYETVTPYTTFGHHTKPMNDISLNVRSHIEQENLIAQQIHEDIKKQLQSKMEELEKLREKMKTEVDRYMESKKNRVKILPSHFHKIKYEKDIGKSIPSSKHEAATSEMSSKDSSEQNFIEKSTTPAFLPATINSGKNQKIILENEISSKLAHIRHNEFNNPRNTSPSSEIDTSIHHHHIEHEHHSKLPLHEPHQSKNPKPEDTSMRARSEGNEKSSHEPSTTRETPTTVSIELKNLSSKFSQTPSITNTLHTQAKQTQKSLHQEELSSQGLTTLHDLHLAKDEPEMHFQTPSILNTEPFSEKPVKVEHVHSGKRCTPQTFHTAEIKSPATQFITLVSERATSLNSLDDRSTLTHPPHHQEKDRTELVFSERPRSKIVTISQHSKSSEGNDDSSKQISTKITPSPPTNKDELFSELAGGPHQLNSDHTYQIHLHTTTPKSSTSELLLKKITEMIPFEPRGKHTTSKKPDLGGISTHQPIHFNEDVRAEPTTKEKLHTDSHISPLLRHHHPQSSEIASFQSTHLSEELSSEVTSSMKPHAEIHTAHQYQPNHRHSESKILPSDKISIIQSVPSTPRIIPNNLNFYDESRPTSHIYSIHSNQKLKLDENFTPHPTHSIDVTLPMRTHAESNSVHPSIRHTEVQNHEKISAFQTVPSTSRIPDKLHDESSSTSHIQSIHSHPKSKHSNENFTLHPLHSIDVTSPMTADTETQKYEKTSTFQPSHSIETMTKKMQLSEKGQEETRQTFNSVHPHTKFEILDEVSDSHLPISSHHHHPEVKNSEKLPTLSTLPPSHSSKINSRETESPLKFREAGQVTPAQHHSSTTDIRMTDSHLPSSSHHYHPEVKNFEKLSTLSTLPPSHSSKINSRETESPLKFREAGQVTPAQHHSSTTDIRMTDSHLPSSSHHYHPEVKNSEKLPTLSTLSPSHSTKINSKERESHLKFREEDQMTPAHHHSPLTDIRMTDTHALKILEEIKNLEKKKVEEIKKLQQKQRDALHESHTHHPAHPTTSTFSTKPYPTLSTIPPTSSDNSEIVEMPKPPLNPNDNWKYLEKLDKYYKKLREKSTTPQPRTIRPPVAIPTARPRIVQPSTTEAPRIRPTIPPRNKTSPNRKPNSTVGPTTTQKPPSPTNYHINSTINRTYNITITMVTPDFTPHEDEKGGEDEANELDIGNELDPITNMVHSTKLPKITSEEPSGDFDSPPHPSLPRESPSQSADSMDFSSIHQTTPLPSSSLKPADDNEPISISQMNIPSRDDSAQLPNFHDNENILQSSSRSATQEPEYLPIITKPHRKIPHIQKISTFEEPTGSTAPSSTTLITNEKTNPPILTQPISSVGNCTPGCNYIIIIPNKTEEVLQILNKNDHPPLTDPLTLLTTPKAAESDPKPETNSFSNMKSLLGSIIQAKMTPSNKTELRDSVNQLLTTLKQRRNNEYARLYLTQLNPVVGDSRESIAAITEINEYIELLQLMLVYLARDPDKLLDESEDARIHNFESPYPKDDPQRRLIEGQFHYVHPKILNEFIDVYKKYSKGERYYGGPAWQFSQENEPKKRSRPRVSGGPLSNLFNFKELIPVFMYRAPMDRPGIQNDYD